MNTTQAIALGQRLARDWFKATGVRADRWRVSELLQRGGQVSHEQAVKVAKVVCPA